MTVWFIGSNPSAKNTDPAVPFEGTKSMLTLMGWLAVLGVTDYKFGNVCGIVEDYQKLEPTETDLTTLYLKLKDEKAVIALGNFSSEILIRLNIKHFKLPHPSPRNRKLNDPIFIESELAKCEIFLKELQCNSTKTDLS